MRVWSYAPGVNLMCAGSVWRIYWILPRAQGGEDSARTEPWRSRRNLCKYGPSSCESQASPPQEHQYDIAHRTTCMRSLSSLDVSRKVCSSDKKRRTGRLEIVEYIRQRCYLLPGASASTFTHYLWFRVFRFGRAQGDPPSPHTLNERRLL